MTEETQFSPPAITIGVREAAQALCLSPRTVERMAQTAELPSFKVGRRRLFSVEALRAWAADRTESSRTVE